MLEIKDKFYTQKNSYIKKSILWDKVIFSFISSILSQILSNFKHLILQDIFKYFPEIKKSSLYHFFDSISLFLTLINYIYNKIKGITKGFLKNISISVWKNFD